MPINLKLFFTRPTFVVGLIIGGLLIGGARPEMINLLEKPYDKIAHTLAYSLITVLIWLSFTGTNKHLAAVGMSALIALMDETYQLFLPGREADPIDFFTDISAIGFTGLILHQLQTSR